MPSNALLDTCLINFYSLVQTNAQTLTVAAYSLNRFRFPLDIGEACSAAIGAERVGIRVPPFGTSQAMGHDFDQLERFVPFVQTLLERIPRLGYVHAVEARIVGGDDVESKADTPPSFSYPSPRRSGCRW
ncbi:hypothetical protein CROQUDRAFT_662467 [Cronartium quercuum f. sp. fusiforme G11]|uniref:NADH:flavin oxidoreductase/NADH oxidase N-terminal domain-containing protein n=1 Tax=Cronartium quercuum f. sp. fusiforme G11 TaxID=708437 RepID=A0A9P6T8E2_9BASI|nr:hypothetical protein CROQUDRAFT_662467 [Cronartium quercuum f. sp. fusiforme G11]